MVRLTTAATVTVAVILATFAYADPASNVEGANVDVSARSEHAHKHEPSSHHHHAARELNDSEDLEARFFRRIARKILGRDLTSTETDLEARDELEARFFKHIARKIFGRDFDDELEARDFIDEEELEARHEHGGEHHHHLHKRSHHHLQKHVERALEGMSDEEIQARAPIFRRIARKIFGRDLTEEELEARAPIFRRIARKIFGRDFTDEELDAREPLFFLGKIAKKVLGRELEEDAELQARGIMPRRRRRLPVGYKGLQSRELEDVELEARRRAPLRGLFGPLRPYKRVAPREIEIEESGVAARSLDELD